MDLTAPSTEDCSLVEVTAPAKKDKTSEDDIVAVLDGKHGNDSTNFGLQKRTSTCTSEDVVDSLPTKKAKTSADEKMCSVCKVTKNRLDCFSKKQRSNTRSNGICKDCNIKANSTPAIKNKKLTPAIKNKKMTPAITNKKITPAIKNKKMTPAEKLVAAARRKLEEEAEKKRKAEKHMQMVNKYAELEEQKYNETKKVYEDGLKELEENNIDLEKEMNMRTRYLYVVTSVCADGDPFSPVLHGIYTTCKKAQDAARRAFEKVSDTYRNGAFVPSHDRLAKCDLSEFLVPAKQTETCRPLYEAFSEEDDDDCHYTAVAIGTIRMVDGKASGCSLPFMTGWFSDQLFNPKLVKNIEEARPEQNEESRKNESEITEVYAIFDQYPGNTGGDHDVNMSGVYSNKDDALNTALELANFEDSDEEENKTQIEEAKGKRRGLLYNDPEGGYDWSVGMESVVLDEHLDEMIELTECSGVWMNPRLSWL